MHTLIITSDKTDWALRPMLYLLNKYRFNAFPILTIAGYTRPDWLDGMTVNSKEFNFFSIGAFENYPVGKWSSGLIKALQAIDDDIIAFLMDDYWLFRDVDYLGIRHMINYMQTHPEVARFDLGTDRLYAAGVTDYARVGHLDVIKSNPASPYHFSFQASLWRRVDLLNLLREDETPWIAEMNGDTRLRALPDKLVLGTRQAPMRYTIAVQQGKFAPDGGYQTPVARMNEDDLAYFKARHWIPTDEQ